MTDETTVSWRAIEAHSPVLSAGGEQVGTVVEVAALDREDIFHGVVFKHHTAGKHLLAPVAHVERVTDQAVHLDCDAATAETFDEFHPERVEELGVKGLFFWKHMGWKDRP